MASLPADPAAPPRLPVERDVFLGREADLAQVADALARAPVVTLLGPGGMGKTRLACRFAWTRLADWPGGAWFCDLSSARDLGDVAAAVARALDVRLDADPARAVGEALRGRGRALLVLDNAEGAVGAVAAAVFRWLDAAPEARFLVTSREGLRIAGEATVALDSLDEASAVALFVERARAADPRLSLADHRDAVVEIARRLDGMPLAIELAAARARVLSPARLLERLERRFEVLANGRRDLPRHATLRAAIDGSWEALSPGERRALAQLSVFAGPFDAAAAEAVISVGDDEPPALAVVDSLVEKSLVRALGGGGLALFASIAEYAAEHLDPADRLAAEARHGRWYAGRASIATRWSPGWVAAVEADAENIVAAGHRAVDRGDASVAEAACWGLAELASRRPYAPAAVALIERTVAMDGLDDRVRRTLSARACFVAPRPEAVDRLLELARAAREADDVAGEIVALQNVAFVGVRVGRHEDARPAVARLRQLRDDLPDLRGRGRSSLAIAMWLRGDGNLAEAVTMGEDALAIAIREGDVGLEAASLANLGMWRSDLGEFERSRENLAAAVALNRRLDHSANEAQTLALLAGLEARLGRHAEAAAAYDDARRLAARAGDLSQWCQSTSNLSIARTMQGAHDDAVTLAREALASAARLGRPFVTCQAAMVLGHALSHRGDHAEAVASLERATAVAREAGLGTSLLADVLGVWSEALTRAGEADAAVVPLLEALVLARDGGNPLTLTDILLRLADAYDALGDLPRSRLYAQEAVGIATGSRLDEAKQRLERARGW